MAVPRDQCRRLYVCTMGIGPLRGAYSCSAYSCWLLSPCRFGGLKRPRQTPLGMMVEQHHAIEVDVVVGLLCGEGRAGRGWDANKN